MQRLFSGWLWSVCLCKTKWSDDNYFHIFCHCLSQQQQEQDPTNLYISNLPLSMDEQELENMLKPFGHVISTRILRDANGLSRGVGFARYARGETRTHAHKLSLTPPNLLFTKKLVQCVGNRGYISHWQLWFSVAAVVPGSWSKFYVPIGWQLSGCNWHPNLAANPCWTNYNYLSDTK